MTDGKSRHAGNRGRAELGDRRAPDSRRFAPSGEGPPEHRGDRRFPRWLNLLDLAQSSPAPCDWLWEGIIPACANVLVAAHGGLNKTLFVLHLAICTALGRPCFGVPTTRTIVLAVLTEDDREEIHRRIAAICAAMNVEIRQLAGWLNIFDGLGCDMALFGRRAATTAEGRTLYTAAPELTEAYDWLQARCEDTNPRLLILDGVSDTFDGDGIGAPTCAASSMPRWRWSCRCRAPACTSRTSTSSSLAAARRTGRRSAARRRGITASARASR